MSKEQSPLMKRLYRVLDEQGVWGIPQGVTEVAMVIKKAMLNDFIDSNKMMTTDIKNIVNRYDYDPTKKTYEVVYAVAEEFSMKELEDLDDEFGPEDDYE